MSGTKTFYLKFDLTKDSLRELPELDALSLTEGAIRTSLILASPGSWDRTEHLTVSRTVDSHWNVIKIPSIEGTELWIVPGSLQFEVEKRVGFEKPSAALLSTLAMHFMQLVYRDPIYRHDVRLEWRSDQPARSCSGLAVLTPATPFSLEQLEMTRDLGSIAFEE